jgi:hypothetical protein
VDTDTLDKLSVTAKVEQSQQLMSEKKNLTDTGQFSPVTIHP